MNKYNAMADISVRQYCCLPAIFWAAFVFLQIFSLPIYAASTIEGVASIKLEHSDRTEYRAGLILGEIPDPLFWGVALLSSDALYSPNLDYVHALKSASGGDGQVLNVPSIEMDLGESGLQSLSMVALSKAPRVGVAACIRNVRPGNRITIVTAAGDHSGKLQRITGRVIEFSSTRNIVELDNGTPIPRVGDPVFVQATQKPFWRALGVVGSVRAPNQVRMVTLPDIFRRLPSESGGWALQPLGLCDPHEVDPKPSFSNKLLKLIDAPIKAIMPRPGRADPELAMRQAWPQIRLYLTSPGIEHYFFNPKLGDQEQSGQFWVSLFASMQETAQIQSPLAAASPVTRLRTKLPGTAADRGWALAIAYTEKSILLLTAHHLVKLGRSGEREIKVYFPELQGLGVDAKRLPFADESLDLAVIAVAADKEFREKVFRIYQMACPNALTGPIQVPVNASGWRRQREDGTIRPGTRAGELHVTGLYVTRGFSGGALLKNGNQIAGILTKDLGTGGGSLAVSIHAALRFFPFGTPGIQRVFCPPPVTLEERVGYQFVKSLFRRSGGLTAPNERMIAKLFHPSDVSRIRVAELPTVQEVFSEGEQLERLLASDEGKSKMQEYLDPVEARWLNELAARENMGVRCAILHGQRMEPASREHIDMTSPIGPNGRPTIRSGDTVGCDLPRSGPEYPRPALRSGLNLTLCTPMKPGMVLLLDNRLWDATFLRKCKELEFGWYVPPGWIQKTAAAAPASPELVQIPAGPFQMGGCRELIGRVNVGQYYHSCNADWQAETFRSITSAFRIQRFPVTVAEYARCIDAGKCNYQLPSTDIDGKGKSPCNWGRPHRARHPMNCINWINADEYCAAVGGRLPTETEWEKAARGTDARRRPWGNDDKLDTSEVRTLLAGGRTLEVGLAPELKSPYGVEDMAWHITEWTYDLYKPYTPGWTAEALLGDEYLRTRVLRGESGTTFERESGLENAHPEDNVGFRCVFP